MANTCIVFSDPSSASNIAMATRDSSQGSHGEWTGVMRFSSLEVYTGQDRNSTATFTITGANPTDTPFLVCGMAVFVVDLGALWFSGVITNVDAEYVGYGGSSFQQRYNISCDSDATYLANYTPLSVGSAYKNTSVHTHFGCRTVQPPHLSVPIR